MIDFTQPAPTITPAMNPASDEEVLAGVDQPLVETPPMGIDFTQPLNVIEPVVEATIPRHTSPTPTEFLRQTLGRTPQATAVRNFPATLEMAKDLPRQVMATPEVAKELVLSSVDFLTYFPPKWTRAIYGMATGEDEAATLQAAENWGVDSSTFVRLMLQPGVPMEKALEPSPAAAETLEKIMPVFEAPRKYLGEPLGRLYGQLTNSAVAGEITTDAVEMIFWIGVAPVLAKGWSAVKGRAVGQKRAARLGKETTPETVAKEGTPAQQAESIARQELMEKTYSPENVGQLIDDLTTLVEAKQQVAQKSGGQVLLDGSDVNVLHQRWLERMAERDQGMGASLQRWQDSSLLLETLEQQPLRNQWTILDGPEPPRINGPKSGNAQFGIAEGRTYRPRTDAELTAAQRLRGDKPVPTAKAKADQQVGALLEIADTVVATLPVDAAPVKPKVRAQDKPKTPDAATQALDDASKASLEREVLGPQLQAKPVKPKAKKPATKKPAPANQWTKTASDKWVHGESFTTLTRQKNSQGKNVWVTDNGVAFESLANAKKSIEANIQAQGGTPAQAAPAAPDRLAALREAQARRQAEKTADFGPHDNSPFRRSLTDDPVRPVTEMFDDWRTLNDGSWKSQDGHISGNKLDKVRVAAANRLLADLMKMRREAIQQGKAFTDFLIEKGIAKDLDQAANMELLVEKATSNTIELPGGGTRPTGIAAAKQVDQFLEANMKAEAESRVTTAKSQADRFLKAWVADDLDVRRYLEGHSNLYAQQALNRKVTARGAFPAAADYFIDAHAKIFKPLSGSEKKALNKLILARSQLDIMTRHEGRRPLGGKHGRAELDAYLREWNNIEQLPPEKMRRVEQAVNDYFSVWNDLLEMKYQAGAIPDWLYGILKEVEYSPTHWLEVVARAQALEQAAHTKGQLSVKKVPRTLEDLQRATPEYQGRPSDLSVTKHGLEKLKSGRQDYLKMNAEELLTQGVSQTFAWLYTNGATKALNRFAVAESMGGLSRPKMAKASLLDTRQELSVPRSTTPAEGFAPYHLMYKDKQGQPQFLQARPDWIDMGTAHGLVKRPEPGKQPAIGWREVKFGNEKLWVHDRLLKSADTPVPVKPAKVAKTRTTELGEEIPIYAPPKKGWQQIYFFEDGVRKAVDVENWFGNEWTKAPTQIRHEYSEWLRLLSGGSLVREMATGSGNPFFFLKSLSMDWHHLYGSNMMKKPDGTWTSAYNKHLPVYSAQLLNDVRHVVQDGFTKNYKDFLKEGGGLDFFNPLTLYPGESVGRLNSGLATWRKYSAWMNARSEIIIRLAHRRRMIEQWKKEGLYGKPGYQNVDATAYARDRLDYSQGGGWGKFADSVVPYANAAIQSTRTFARAAQKNPWEVGLKTAEMAAFTASVYAAGKLLYPEALDATNRYERVNNWTIPTGLSVTDDFGEPIYINLKIRKDPVQTIPATLAEMGMAAALGEEVDFMQLWDSLLSMTPVTGKSSYLPPAAKSLMSYMFNKNMLTGEDAWRGPDVLAKDEWTPGMTSALYRDVVGSLGMSPDRFRTSTHELITSNNPYAEGLYYTYDALFNELDQRSLDEMAADYLLEVVGRRSVLSLNRPGIDTQEQDKQKRINREENSAQLIVNRKLDIWMDDHFLRGTRDLSEVTDYIMEVARHEDLGPRFAERMETRLELYQEMLEVPSIARARFMSIAALDTSRARAREVVRWMDASSEAKKQIIWQGLGVLQTSQSNIVPKSFNTEFWETFARLRAEQGE